MKKNKWKHKRQGKRERSQNGEKRPETKKVDTNHGRQKKTRNDLKNKSTKITVTLTKEQNKNKMQ